MKVTYRRIILKINSGDSEAEAAINLPSGDRIIAVAADGGITPSSLVSIKIEESGNEIHPFMSHKLFDGAIGSFSQRGVELETSRGGDWTVLAKSTENVDADTYIEMNFMVQTRDSSCE